MNFGLNVQIIRSSNKEWEGKKGIIKDETYNMLIIEFDDILKSFTKANHVFELEMRDKSKIQVEGQLLEGYPEQRIKKKWKSW